MQALDQPLDPKAVIVTLRGDCDMARKEELRNELAQAKGAGVAIVDLSETGYIDSAGLGEIVRIAWMVINAGGKFRVVTPLQHQKRIFNLLGLTKKIELFDTLAQASAVAP